MPRHLPKDIPQVIAIASLSKGGKANVKKTVRQHLDWQAGQPLYLKLGDECLLSAAPGGTELAIERSRAILPEPVLAWLKISPGASVAFLQRDGAVAVKRVEIKISESDHACLFDVERARAVIRTIETNPMPDVLLPRLATKYADLELAFDVAAFLSGRQTLDAWRSRRLLKCPDADDETLRRDLIDARLAQQVEDGSWKGSNLLTARCLRELASLGLDQAHAAIQRGASWLLDRPQSPHNPGMFFATDELVADQVDLIARRKQGVKGLRFRAIKSSEKKRIMSGDDLIQAPCGPRIMWPNALALDALLRLGYEGHERVQTALQFMRTRDWCECGYQHGNSGWHDSQPLTDEQLGTFESICINQYQYGGLRAPQLLLKEASLADGGYLRRLRVEVPKGDGYALMMPDHIQGCEFITTRAMSSVQDARMRRFAEAHLWRFAGLQRPDGSFPPERYGTGFDQIGILDAFARYDHPASRVVVMRALPWIVDAQNEDGSWGQGERKDAATSAVLFALLSLGDTRPAHLWHNQ